MNYWLLKSEPSTWSWSQQITHKKTHWDGVRNFQAANNLKKMKVGDLAFFYHSGDERQIVGVVQITREAYPDPTDSTGKFVMVDVAFSQEIPNPISLKTIKEHPQLQTLPLVRQSRLSVMPIDSQSWKILCALGNISC